MIFCDEKENAMEEKVIEEGYYKIRRKKGSHVNRKINSDGSKSAIQFFDGTIRDMLVILLIHVLSSGYCCI